MARLNIEPSLFIKRGWLDLVIKIQDSEKALGALVQAWAVAQVYWKDSDLGIPKEVWKKERLNDALIGTMADDMGDFIYMHGSREQFSWLRKASENGKKGGRRGSPEIIEEKTKPPLATLPEPLTSFSFSPSPSFSFSDSSSSSNSESQGKARSDSANRLHAQTALPEFEPVAEVIRERGISGKAQAAWLKAFPEPAWIISEIRKALAWEASNPRKRKKNFTAFMTNWMNTGWDRRDVLTNRRSTNYAADREASNRESLEAFRKSVLTEETP